MYHQFLKFDWLLEKKKKNQEFNMKYTLKKVFSTEED